MITSGRRSGNDRLSPGEGGTSVSCPGVVARDEVIDGLSRAIAALQRERADIDDKIQRLQTTLDQLQAPDGDGATESPKPPSSGKKKGKRPRKKKASAKSSSKAQDEAGASSVPEL